jgi:hypothetical protein
MQLAEEGTLGVLGTCPLFDKISRADNIFIRQMLTIRPLRESLVSEYSYVLSVLTV